MVPEDEECSQNTTSKGWILSPVYDVNPSTDKTEMLHTAIAEDNNIATIENALKYAEYFRLNKTDAEKITNDMMTVIRTWQQTAKKYGLNQAEINRLITAFKV